MSLAYERHVGSLIKVVKAVNPTNATADVTGSSVDRTDYLSGVLHLACGAASGAPTAQSVSAKIQHSDDGSTWADAGIATSALTANNSEVELDVNLAGLKKYVRVVVLVSFTGGTSPAIPVAATLVLGGARVKSV